MKLNEIKDKHKEFINILSGRFGKSAAKSCIAESYKRAKDEYRTRMRSLTSNRDFYHAMHSQIRHDLEKKMKSFDETIKPKHYIRNALVYKNESGTMEVILEIITHERIPVVDITVDNAGKLEYSKMDININGTNIVNKAEEKWSLKAVVTGRKLSFI